MAITPFNTTRAPVPSGDPFEQLFRRLVDGDASPATAGAFSPSLDVREDEDVFTLYVELPGVSADDVDVTLEDNVLTVAGHRRSYDEAEEDSSVGWSGRLAGSTVRFDFLTGSSPTTSPPPTPTGS